MATGFALGNSILIEAPEGAIIVDVTETLQSGSKALAALRTVSKSPIKAIIYTHNHADHVFGAKVDHSRFIVTLVSSAPGFELLFLLLFLHRKKTLLSLV